MHLIGRVHWPDIAILPIGGHYTMDSGGCCARLELLGVKRCLHALPMRGRSAPPRHSARQAAVICVRLCLGLTTSRLSRLLPGGPSVLEPLS